MKLWKWILAVVAPLVLLVVHFVCMAVLEGDRQAWFLSELGPTENLTFLVFLIAGIVGLVVFVRVRAELPRLRWLILLFALASIFMGFEEVSYFQHHLGYETPESVAKVNKQAEFNIHNLGDDSISRILRRIAEIGLPIFGIALPLVLARFPRTYQPGDWTYYLLPRHELIVVLLLCLFVRINHELDDAIVGARLTEGLSELQELFWAMAGLIWILIVRERWLARPSATAPAGVASQPTR